MFISILKIGKSPINFERIKMIKTNNKVVKEILSLEKAVKKVPAEYNSIRKYLNFHHSLSEQLALIREEAFKVQGLKAHQNQLLGVLNLINGKIIDLKTGEGKTLVATLAAIYLSLHSYHVQIITVNDYLAQRDLSFNRKLFQLFGLSNAFITAESQDFQRKIAYDTSICYLTAEQAGFDYLKDNLKHQIENQVQIRDIAIIDEVDSILLDSVNTPLVIANQSQKTTEIYNLTDKLVKLLQPEHDFILNLEKKTVSLTKIGVKKLNNIFHQDINQNKYYLYFINKSLQANFLYQKDRDYLVTREGKIALIDLNTNRIAKNRAFTDGLQQAIEAKEKLKIEPDNYSIASVSLFDFFSNYCSFSGMSGTAWIDKRKFKKLYHKTVVPIKTNKPVKRKILPEQVFYSSQEKQEKILKKVQDIHATGQPILVGTLSVKNAELYSSLLKKAHLEVQTLTAKVGNEDAESKIISLAGQKNAITVATNMAGRGTDIKISSDVSNLGGLFVLVTEHSQSKRVDEQFAGRTARQGQPGTVQFFSSYEDDLFRIHLNQRQNQELKNKVTIPTNFYRNYISFLQNKISGQELEQALLLKEFNQIDSIQRDAFYESRENILITSVITPVIDFIYRTLKLNKEKIQLPSNLHVIYTQDFKNKIIDELDFIWQQHLEDLEILKQKISLINYLQIKPITLYTIKANELFKSMKKTMANKIYQMLT